jgi:hypothetical protein
MVFVVQHLCGIDVSNRVLFQDNLGSLLKGKKGNRVRQSGSCKDVLLVEGCSGRQHGDVLRGRAHTHGLDGERAD